METLGSVSDSRGHRARSMARERPAGAKGGAGHVGETLRRGRKDLWTWVSPQVPRTFRRGGSS